VEEEEVVVVVVVVEVEVEAAVAAALAAYITVRGRPNTERLCASNTYPNVFSKTTTCDPCNEQSLQQA
jgi:hypothetical protein